MPFLFMLLVMILFDRAVPLMVRMYGAGVFPWGEKEPVASFYRNYGWVAFPRTLFLLLTCLAVSLNHVVPVDENVLLIIGIISVILWVVFAGRDVWKAKNGAVAPR
jgi:hypothetical protein